MSALARTVLVAIVSAVIAGVSGFAIARATESAPPRADRDAVRAPLDEPSDPLVECESRLASAEEALAQRAAPPDGSAIDSSALPEETRAVIASPEVDRAIAQEVERRIAEHFERERARRDAEWAARRAELRERMRAIGIDDATMGAVAPAMCAMREIYREAWRSGRAGSGPGDAGVRMGRRELREATAPMREEVETALGPERLARLEDEGGLRALGGAIECEGEGSGPPFGPRR